MTDLEMTKLAAEAMGMSIDPLVTPSGVLPIAIRGNVIVGTYDPLHDDAQAMALVKEETLDVTWGPGELRWRVGQFRFGCEKGMEGKDGIFCEIRNTDLNRAIVECVAKMQEAK